MEKYKYYAVSFYKLFHIDSPNEEYLRWKLLGKELDLKGRIYISEQGINAQMSILSNDYEKLLKNIDKGININVQEQKEHVFEKLKIKIRKQLVALDKEVNLENSAEKIEPEEWAKMMKDGSKHIVIDVRNNYETEIGYFENSIKPDLSQFRDFRGYVDKIKNHKNDSIMMFCTGGIRCEFFSALLKENGFKKVVQLKGGILNYAKKLGSLFWKGNIFVFDDRISIPVGTDREYVSNCKYCNIETATYHNCANMECNKLFISCICCAKKHQGLCSTKCKSGRVRKIELSDRQPKPFRKYKKIQTQSTG